MILELTSNWTGEIGLQFALIFLTLTAKKKMWQSVMSYRILISIFYNKDYIQRLR